jgi:hypothetical protein
VLAFLLPQRFVCSQLFEGTATRPDGTPLLYRVRHASDAAAAASDHGATSSAEAGGAAGRGAGAASSTPKASGAPEVASAASAFQRKFRESLSTMKPRLVHSPMAVVGTRGFGGSGSDGYEVSACLPCPHPLWLPRVALHVWSCEWAYLVIMMAPLALPSLACAADMCCRGPALCFAHCRCKLTSPAVTLVRCGCRCPT